MLQSVSAEGFQKDTVCNSIPVGSTVHHLFYFFLEFAEDDLIPIGSMYGIYANIGDILMVNGAICSHI